MPSTNLLLEEPIRMTSILEPSNSVQTFCKPYLLILTDPSTDYQVIYEILSAAIGFPTSTTRSVNFDFCCNFSPLSKRDSRYYDIDRTGQIWRWLLILLFNFTKGVQL